MNFFKNPYTPLWATLFFMLGMLIVAKVVFDPPKKAPALTFHNGVFFASEDSSLESAVDSTGDIYPKTDTDRAYRKLYEYYLEDSTNRWNGHDLDHPDPRYVLDTVFNGNETPPDSIRRRLEQNWYRMKPMGTSKWSYDSANHKK